MFSRSDLKTKRIASQRALQLELRLLREFLAWCFHFWASHRRKDFCPVHSLNSIDIVDFHNQSASPRCLAQCLVPNRCKFRLTNAFNAKYTPVHDNFVSQLGIVSVNCSRCSPFDEYICFTFRIACDCEWANSISSIHFYSLLFTVSSMRTRSFSRHWIRSRARLTLPKACDHICLSKTEPKAWNLHC